jgi:hypothetical protein
MASARDLLEIAADYVEARRGAQLAAGMGAEPDDLTPIVQRFETALGEYLAERD